MKKRFNIIGLLLIVILNVGIFNIISNQNSINLEDVFKIQSVSAEGTGIYIRKPYSSITGINAYSIFCENGRQVICTVVYTAWGVECHSGGDSACSSYDSVGMQTSCPCDPS